MLSTPTLSLVVPCYNEAACIDAFVEEVNHCLSILTEIEIVFIDDGSTDYTLEKIKALAKVDSRIHYLSFSRNFGKEAALLAGLRKASGDLVATLDVDLQDPPSLLPEMLRAILNEKYDCVATRRSTRIGEPVIRSWFARRFYWLMRHFSDIALVDGARDYRMMTRQVLDAILSMPEINRFTKGIYSWVGFNTKWIEFENIERAAGTTKWSFFKLFKYSLEGIMAFSTAPLQIASVLGLLCCIGSLLTLIFVFIRALLFDDPVGGWASLVCFITFLGGVQLFVTGILGNYLAKTYLETKRRPMYFIKEEL